jgi:Zn-dependent M28 family amino/carboxypeptidase
LEHQKEIKGKLVLDGNYSPPGAFLQDRDPVNLYRETLYGYLVQFGAAGLIYTNRHYGGLLKTGTARSGFIGEIPACGIARETSQLIVRHLVRGKGVASLHVRNSYAPGAKSNNVVADLLGDRHPEEVIFVGAHYDGHDISQGAMDDAAGVCVVMEAARAVAKHTGSLRRTIRFCCFGGEEVGLNGSTGYVLGHSDELKDIAIMINCDAAGISGKTGHSFVVNGSEDLVGYLEKILDSIGAFDRGKEVPKVVHSTASNGDHWPFYMLGVPTAHFRDVPPDPVDRLYSHTAADTVDKVDPKGMNDAAIVLALTLVSLANEEHIPVKHTPREEIINILEERKIVENLRVEKQWHREIPNG